MTRWRNVGCLYPIFQCMFLILEIIQRRAVCPFLRGLNRKTPVDNVEKYFLKMCEKHLTAFTRGVRDPELAESIRKLILQIEDFDKKYRRYFYIRMADFFGLTILVRVDSTVPVPDTCGEGAFTRIKDNEQWVGVVRDFYNRIRLCVEMGGSDPESMNDDIKQFKGNMEISSGLWERFKKEQGL